MLGVLFTTLLGAVLSSAASLNPASCKASEIIHRDVAIIGGGSAGIYSAIALKDSGKSVVVIERQDRLGGHAETYVYPPTGATVNLGVIVFPKTTIVQDYFARLRVPLTNLSSFGASQYVDFSTGRVVNYTLPSVAEIGAAFGTYAQQLLRFPALQTSFNLTYPVAEDLLLPFGDFVTKYNLGAMMPIIYLTSQGYTPLLQIPTLYIFKQFGLDLVTTAGQYYTTLHSDTQELYRNALAELGSGQNAFLSSSVIAMDRSQAEVRILVRTPQGRKLIIAKKLISAVPPLVPNLRGYDLSTTEKGLFSQFYGGGYYTGIINNTGFPEIGFTNIAPGRPYNIPASPSPYVFIYNPTIAATQFYYGSAEILSVEAVKNDILKIVDRYRRANNVQIYSKPEFVTLKNHAPFNVEVSVQAIRDGFYDRLNKLQGQRNTFYAGATFATHDSNVIWQNIKSEVLPKLYASLA